MQSIWFDCIQYSRNEVKHETKYVLTREDEFHQQKLTSNTISCKRLILYYAKTNIKMKSPKKYSLFLLCRVKAWCGSNSTIAPFFSPCFIFSAKLHKLAYNCTLVRFKEQIHPLSSLVSTPKHHLSALFGMIMYGWISQLKSGGYHVTVVHALQITN